jgi:hypothetical protein
MKRGEAQRADPNEAVINAARDTRRKAAFLLRKPYVEQGEVYTLAKAFFKAYLRKEYEFTAQELQREVHKVYLSTLVRERVEAIIEKLSLLEYTDMRYSQTEVKLLLQELDSLVKMLVTEHRRQVPRLTRFANWLFRKQPRTPETVISDYPSVEPNDPVTLELSMLLEDIYALLERNKAQKAAKIYRRLLAKYQNLGSTGKQQFYHKVNEAYDAITKQTK